MPLALATTVCAWFWIPAWKVSRGFFPAPLDDVYIHFDYARALAQGHPFEWIPGNGYSSGETSPAYALLLGFGHLIGFHERALGLWAAMVTVASLAYFVRCMMHLLGPLPLRAMLPLAALPLALGVTNWTLVSGMEMASTIACLAGTLVALERTRAEKREGLTREAAQWRLGLWGFWLVLFRPESIVLVLSFAIVAARGARVRSGFMAAARAALPGVVATLLVMGANWIATGDARSAGAQLKLLSSNPYITEVDRARALVENILTFFMRGFRASIGPGFIAVPVLALVGAWRRSAAAGAVIGALAWTALVSWNGNAPYHNYRYYVPAAVLIMMAVSIGLASMARKYTYFTAVTGAVLVFFAAERIPPQVEHYVRAVANVRDQQVEVGTRLAKMPADALILVGDAGAIPYLSQRRAIDAMGLGGYNRMPFAQAAVYGEAATLELIERLDPAERPTHLALYPNWFGAITSRFGTEIDRVTIRDNLICGGPTKGIYVADWSALEGPSSDIFASLDELDVADVVSEREHGYAPPTPDGGWTTLDVLTDRRGDKRFDGGRVIPEGRKETFVVRHAPEGGKARITVRIDAASGSIRARTHDNVVSELTASDAVDGSWRVASADLDLAAGDTIELEAARGTYRDYHVWITRR